MADFELTGISEINRRLKDIEKSMRDNLSTALEIEMQERVVDRAKNEFVPVGLGELKDSIRLVKAKVEQGRTETGQYTEGADLVVRVIAGGPGIDHAVSVHETPSQYDPPTWQGKDVKFRVGGSKYLERPLFEAENGLLERIGSKVEFK